MIKIFSGDGVGLGGGGENGIDKEVTFSGRVFKTPNQFNEISRLREQS